MQIAAGVATCMCYTGIDPFTKKPVHVAKGLRDRKVRRALMQFFKPQNYFEVRDALVKAGRADLIGDGCDCLIPAKAPNEALAARREHASQAVWADYYHALPTPAKRQKGRASNRVYRLMRKTQQRRAKPDRGTDGPV
jgi:hypothetical protein